MVTGTEPRGGFPNAALAVYFFQKPGRVLPKGLHGSEGFRIVSDLTRIASYADIPVTGPHNDHLLVLEKVIQRVRGVNRSGTPHRCHGRPHLAFEETPIGCGHHAAASRFSRRWNGWARCVPTSRSGANRWCAATGHYNNVSRGKRKEAGTDDDVPCILEPQGDEKTLRRNWARLIQKIYEVDPLVCPKYQGAKPINRITDAPLVIHRNAFFPSVMLNYDNCLSLNLCRWSR